MNMNWAVEKYMSQSWSQRSGILTSHTLSTVKLFEVYIIISQVASHTLTDDFSFLQQLTITSQMSYMSV